MSSQQANNGKWVVIAIIALGVAGALVGLKFRYMPVADQPATTTAR